MRKEDYLQFVASFLVALMLSIPFYTAGVYATPDLGNNQSTNQSTSGSGAGSNVIDGINSISAKGNDGIEGFIKGSDFITFVVKVAIGSSTIAKDQVKLGSSIIFDSCTASANNGYICALRYPGSGNENFQGPIPYTINLFNDDRTT